ncbi:glutathione S-transferase family protein [Paraburkholderia saeva]|uniref:Disulfide-bond oxidoreductase YfcG n=1 Tax=Paraburkholderia saeva TaxID=2777537 RepID=A0A9N8X437_9BURK|nr:glutathione S-transferase family protein [Paraburkholderia saeva]CAG4888976.1 Disulfide-bond oxidoreductase YfcG [Paraburkholderia saeva]CAG4894074.1 Disulfide-bond oxidoreductase YfcG [Paraburkholderia saeva]CAG4916771.1 Disulfide-bond oxidoreductase YfcG [Paraburkholderia saeva]
MKLYYAETLTPRKACAVARYLDLPMDYVHLDLKKGEHTTPDYRAINPNCKVPCLVDGDRTIWEADAIMCHLAQRAGSSLWPGDTRQTEVLRWLSWNSHHLYRHAGTLYFEFLIKPNFGMGEPDPATVAQEQDAFRRFAGVLDRHLEGRQWLVGDDLTIADFSVAVSLPYAKAAAIPLEEFPQVQRWHDQLGTLDAWRNPFPARAMANA